MSTDRDTTRAVRSWLEEGVTALPDRVLDGGQQLRSLLGRDTAALSQIGVAAAPPGQRALDQVRRGQPATLRRGVDRHDE